ncbi:MAG: type II CAAX endopeptidase family protein [Spirosomataceae bacterium]|mgnify:CR=1 FL=1
MEEFSVQQPNSTQPSAYPTFRQALGLIGLFILVSIVIGVVVVIPLTATFESFNLPKAEASSWLDLIGYTLPLGFILWYAINENRKIESGWHFSWEAVPLSIYFYLFFITVGMAVLLEPIVEAIPMPEVIRKMFEDLFKNTLVSFALISIIGPIMEELLMRGIILKGFLQRYTPQQSILWSALLFGVIHLNPWQFITAFMMGLVLGWIYYKTNSLWPCIFAHILNNSLSSIVVMWTNNPMATARDLAGSDGTYYLILVIALVLVIGSFWQLYQVFNPKKA